MDQPIWTGEKIRSKMTGKAAVLLLGSSFLFVLFQFYLLRELLAAEILLALTFVLLLVVVGIIYAIGMSSEWGLEGLVVKVHSNSRPVLRERNLF